MLLARLVEYASTRSDEVPPPYYRSEPVRWVLTLHPDGTPASAELIDYADQSDRTIKNGPNRVIPSITKTSGIAPRIGVDTPEYLFGWVAEDAKPERARKAHQAFRALTEEWATADPDGPAGSLQAFYTGGHAERFAQPPSWGRADLIAVRLAGEFLHDTESARRFWVQVASSRKALGVRGLCLVCGQVDDLLKTIPQKLPTRLVPLATQTTSLVSVNKATHGFDLQEQLVHTPICVSCGLAAMGALERLLDDQWKSALAGQDTRLAWWVTNGGDLDLDALDQPTPERVAHLVGDAARGRRSPLMHDEELATFCAVAIGGNVSRVAVREWIELPLHGVQDNLANWFADHEIVDAWTGQVQQIGAQRLARAAGRWNGGKGGSNGSYAKFGASGSDRPQGIHRALLASALLGRPLPPKLLAHTVRRIRADGRLDTERAALVRLALRRRMTIPDREVYLPTLNPDNHQPAYLSGRIFAVLEDIQLSAARTDGDEAPNVTFADRYFARAVTSPAVALVAGRRDAQAWLKRMRRTQPAFAHNARQRLDDLVDRLAEAGGIPHGAVLADQAAFILGYHQQWADLRSGRRKQAGDKQTTTEETTAAQSQGAST
ncbi:type I-C CRISPR-associated protein Cas8c/Csd1 [Spirillospora sp. NPDC048911]|uniref:type I-C CRISPR-associated protein Cas8c/Csd1 n=1 Tax=Spirillospora sp. NPDC048911 TaxID=3364527 RepID=UPI00372255BE